MIHTPRLESLVRAFTVVAIASGSTVLAQTTQITLNYNFNGIVHAGETANPDAPAGFRSISDRALDFSGGVPVNSLLAPYSIVATAGALDIVHLGNRNTVDGGTKVFDTVVDGDNIGIQPTWLANVDQSGPQTTTLASPLLIQPGFTTKARFLFQISNGGGSFDVTFGFTAGSPLVASLSGPDWFGGVFTGAANVDFAGPGNNLSISEGTVDLSAQGGRTLNSISFSNRSNTNAGYAIIAAKLDAVAPNAVIQIPLNYNFNGIVHAGEAGNPDAPAGFRSISDRALDFSAGVPNHPLLAPYSIVATPGALDIVHLGDRNSVDFGSKAFDTVVDGDAIGIQPTWLANTDQTGPQTTTLAPAITLDASSSASFLYQISNGGGSFDVTFGFQTGSPTTVNLSGPDWFGGVFTGTGNIDMAAPDNNLSISEGNVNLGANAGRVLTSITFSNRSNTNAGYAILAADVSVASAPIAYCTAGTSSNGCVATISANHNPSVALAGPCNISITNLEGQKFGIIFYGISQAGFSPTPWAVGSTSFLCVKGPTQRTGTGSSGGTLNLCNGVRSLDWNAYQSSHLGAVGNPWSVGNHVYVQGWYRDPPAPKTTNLSNALVMTYLP
jgi:hypothetical protein